MRLSKAQGEAKALRLAEKYLVAQDSNGWTLKCVSAKPDYMLSPATHCKTPTKWAVVVECSKDGVTLDGPMVLVVDLAREEVMTFEQATQEAK